MLLRSPVRRFLFAAMVAVLPAVPAQAASVIAVATLGDGAPGGGIFAGSGFLGRPAAGGDGWVAFRSLLAPSGSTEELVLANMNPATPSRQSVARTGEQLSEALGTIGDFIGHPAVNASGQVAFVVTLDPPEPPADGDPTPAALLLFDPATGALTVLATAGAATPVGRLALAEGAAGTTPSLEERTPSLTDDGDVAFTAVGIDGDAATPAVFLLQQGTLAVLAAAGDTTSSSTFATFGPPVLSRVDHVAFRATLTGGTLADAIFLWRDGVLTRVAANGDTVTTTEPESHLQMLTAFAPVVDLDADDTVAFLGGPLRDFTFGSTSTDFGVLAWRDGALSLVAFPGQTFGDRGRVTGVELLAEFGGTVVPPRLLPDGSVFFHAELNGGSSGALAHGDGGAGGLVEIAIAGGSTPSGTPIGGSYSAFTLPPTIDGTGAVVATAELDGAPASDALVWGVGDASAQVVVAGEPSPGASGAFLAGPSFANPALTQAGDVVFRSTVASGPSAVGLYRWSRGETTALVRAGDPAPVPDALPFLNIVGQHDVSDDGTVVFAGLVEGLHRGIYAIEDGVVVRVAVEGDLVRLPSGVTATFDTLLPNPSVASDGTYAFRARVEFEESGATRRRDGIFLKAGAQIRAAVLEDDVAPTGEAFALFREIAVAGGGRVAFVADLTDGDTTTRRGLFLVDAGDVRSVVVEGDRIVDRVTGFIGAPELNDRGTIAQLVRLEGTDAEQAALVRGTPARVDVVARVGDDCPAGGVYRSLGRPAMNGDGDVAFRATFEPGSGGSPGLYTATGTTVQPTVAIGDPGPSALRGQFIAFNQRLSLAGNRAIAFLGSLAGGTVRDGVFLGDPTNLGVPRLRMKVGSRTKPDRLTLKIRLASGTATRALDLASSRVRITVQDSAGARWSELISPGGFRRRRHAFVYSSPLVPKFKLKVAKSGLIRGVVRAKPDLTGGGLFPIVPPVTVDVEVADVSAQTSLNCLVSAKRVRCR